MGIKSILKSLEKSREFRKWHKENKDTYFSFAFNIPQEMHGTWQIGYYNSKKDKVTTFVVDGQKIEIKPEEEVFKREESKVNAIELKKIKLDIDSAITEADGFQQKNFPKDRSMKTIAILQNISHLGNVWNITYITQAFNTLNMKIDAASGKILEHNFASIFSFKQK